jgi:hypothetical protein
MFNSIRVDTRSLVLVVLLLTFVACGAPQPTSTPIPPANTPVPPTDTPVPPTSTPTPEPPTDTPSPTAKPTREPKTLATSAEEIMGEYSVPSAMATTAPGYLDVLVFMEDGSFDIYTADAKGSRQFTDARGTWRFEDAQLKLEYSARCLLDPLSAEKAEGIVGTYEVHYRMLGGDRPARLYFTAVDDQCYLHRLILTRAPVAPTTWTSPQPWKRYEP